MLILRHGQFLVRVEVHLGHFWVLVAEVGEGFCTGVHQRCAAVLLYLTHSHVGVEVHIVVVNLELHAAAAAVGIAPFLFVGCVEVFLFVFFIIHHRLLQFFGTQLARAEVVAVQTAVGIAPRTACSQ